jgi:hypothetical protein
MTAEQDDITSLTNDPVAELLLPRSGRDGSRGGRTGNSARLPTLCAFRRRARLYSC